VAAAQIQSVGGLRRISLRPDVWLPWLTVLGFGSYVVSWLGREQFYAAFGVTPALVGVDYPSLLIPAAVVGVFLVLTLVVVTVFLVPIFVPVSRRAAKWQMKVGGLIFLSVFVTSVIMGAIFGDSGEKAIPILSVPWMLGGLFFGHGFGSWVGRRTRRHAVRDRLRRLHRRAGSPEEALAAYLVEQRARRRRRAARRAERGGVRREAGPATVVFLLWLAAVLYIALGSYLSDAATRAAHNAVSGKTDLFVGADGLANVLLNVQVRAVQIDAIEPRFRQLQQAQLIYLGTNGGAYVLYNRTAHHAVLIPSGSVALRFDPGPALN
jgi:hypothetical protein